MSARRPSGAVRAALFALALLACAASWLASRSEGLGLLWDRFGFVAFVANAGLSMLVLAGGVAWLPAGPVRPRLFGLLLTGITLGLCLAVAELPALLLDHDYSATFRLEPVSTLEQLQGKVNQPDPELIHVHWPNTTFDGEVVGNLVALGIPNPKKYAVQLRYDRNGFRNERDLDSAAVVAIGDSFVEAVLVPLEQTLSERIARAISQPVANLGQSAYGLQQELVVLRRFGLPLRPRVVLWFLFGGNDFRDIAYYEDLRANFGKALERPAYRQRSFLRSALFALSKATLPARVSGAAQLQNAAFVRADGGRDTLYFGQATDPPTAEEWRVGTDSLREAARLSRAANAELVVVYIPRKFEVYQGRLDVPPGSRLHSWSDPQLNRRVAEWASSEAIAYLDTTDVLRGEVERGSHPYLPDDVHWNGRGHQLVAEQIVRWLRAHPAMLADLGSDPGAPRVAGDPGARGD